MKVLEYSFLRAEKNNDMVVFIKVEPEWLDKDINFGYKDQKFVIELSEGEKYQSKEVDLILKERLENQSTPIIFTNNEGVFLAEINLSPNNKKKVKP